MPELNLQQRQAITYLDGPLLVLAGAGSGKTWVIIEKIRHLILTQRIPAEKIYAITFTNKSAKEMLTRVQRVLPKKQSIGLTVCTFHALGLRFIQQEYQQIGLRPKFSLFDAHDSRALIRELLPHKSSESIDACCQWISQQKNSLCSPDKASADDQDQTFSETYQSYQKQLMLFNAIDFDDLIYRPVCLLNKDPVVADRWRNNLHYVLIDEYQDTNNAQYLFMKLLAGSRGALTCVGDDDQSIYTWRGANPENIDQLCQDYRNLKIIKLEQNYRCTNTILRAANALIAHNRHLHPKTLWSNNALGDRICIWSCHDVAEEAERVATEIAYLKNTQNIPGQEIAILFRSNFQSRPFEKALQSLHISYQLTTGTALVDAPEIKDLLSWLRVIINPNDNMAFLRACQSPKREIGTVSISKLAELANQRQIPFATAAQLVGVLAQLPARSANSLSSFTDLLQRFRDRIATMPPHDFIMDVADKSGLLHALRVQAKNLNQFQRYQSNIAEFSRWFEPKGRDAPPLSLASQLALMTRDESEDTPHRVRMMTLHASKGLEFRSVFIIGCQQGILPHEANANGPGLEEERRLLYVGLTRARLQLWLSYSRSASRHGVRVPLSPSLFFDEIPTDCIRRDGDDPIAEQAQKRARAQAGLASIAALFD